MHLQAFPVGGKGKTFPARGQLTVVEEDREGTPFGVWGWGEGVGLVLDATIVVHIIHEGRE